jgi:RNA polymerase sigma factor (sigma-70 family)
VITFGEARRARARFWQLLTATMLLASNPQLLESFRRGERDALVQVYEAYAPSVAKFLRSGFSFSSGGRRCRFAGAKSRHDLEDRLHDVFLRAFSDAVRLRYDGMTPYCRYLFAIARNLVIDELRRTRVVATGHDEARHRGEEPPCGVSDPFTGELDMSGDPAVDRESAEILRLIRDFRDALAEQERIVFRLRFEEENGHNQIAAKTGLTVSKIKTSEQRIRARLFAFMRGHGYFERYQSTQAGWLVPCAA